MYFISSISAVFPSSSSFGAASPAPLNIFLCVTMAQLVGGIGAKADTFPQRRDSAMVDIESFIFKDDM